LIVCRTGEGKVWRRTEWVIKMKREIVFSGLEVYVSNHIILGSKESHTERTTRRGGNLNLARKGKEERRR